MKKYWWAALTGLLVLGLFLFKSPSPKEGLEVTIRRGNSAEPQTLDPHKLTGVPEYNITLDLFDGLMKRDEKGGLILGSAEKFDLQEEGLKYTFYLNPNLKWSNGSPLTAHDFEFSFKRALDPKTATPNANLLSAIKNAGDVIKGEKPIEELGVKAKDIHTLEITLNQKTPYFLELLAHPISFPLSKEVLEKQGDAWVKAENYVSNGAFVLKEWQPHSHITLVKNTNHPEVGTLKIDQVVYLPIEDKGAELKQFRAEEIDLTDAVPLEQLAWVQENLKESFSLSPYLGVEYYAVNMTAEPFKSHPELVKALSLAVDRDLLINKILKSGELPAYGLIPPRVTSQEVQFLNAGGLTQGEREALAQKIFAAEGFSTAKPLKLELLYNTSENRKKVAVAVASMWKKVLGIETELVNVEWKVYLERRKVKDFQVARGGWIADYKDPRTFLEIFLSDAPNNYVGFNSLKFDHLVQKSDEIFDSKKREGVLIEAEETLLKGLPFIPLYFTSTKHLVNPKLKGFQANVQDIHPSQYFYLEGHSSSKSSS